MLDVGTVLSVESNNKNRDIAFASAVKHGEIPVSRSSYGEARNLLQELGAVFIGSSTDEINRVTAARENPRLLDRSRPGELGRQACQQRGVPRRDSGPASNALDRMPDQ